MPREFLVEARLLSVPHKFPFLIFIRRSVLAGPCQCFVFGFWDLLWVSQGQYLIFGALCPSKSGLMNKHIVKHSESEIL